MVESNLVQEPEYKPVHLYLIRRDDGTKKVYFMDSQCNYTSVRNFMTLDCLLSENIKSSPAQAGKKGLQAGDAFTFVFSDYDENNERKEQIEIGIVEKAFHYSYDEARELVKEFRNISLSGIRILETHYAGRRARILDYFERQKTEALQELEKEKEEAIPKLKTLEDRLSEMLLLIR